MKTNMLSKISILAVCAIVGGMLLFSSCSKQSSSQATKPAICTDPTVQAKFAGDLSQFLQGNINYPQIAKEKGISGTVFVSFIVNSDGSITDAKILKGPDSNLDYEALRVINTMPKWIPAQKDGNPVNVQFNLPIRFELK